MQTHPIRLTLQTKNKFNAFIKQERQFFNAILMEMNARLRRNPASILRLEGKLRDVFVDCCQIGCSLKAILELSDRSLIPPLIARHSAFLDTLLLDRDMLSFFDIAQASGKLHPLVRRNIALEAVSFYRHQAVIASHPVEDGYKVPINFWDQVDESQKRHLQIPRELVQITTTDDGVSLVTTPYNSEPFEVLHRVNYPWTIMVIHQQNGRARSDSPWVADFIDTKDKYLTRKLEVQAPLEFGSLFNACRQGSR